MEIAINKEGQRITAIPEITAFCQSCGNKVISRCGEINVWHFAHKIDNECWGSKEESLWHRFWKGKFMEQDREIAKQLFDTKRIADVIYCGYVLEFQTKLPDVYEIQKRQEFWLNYPMLDGKYKFRWILKNNDQFFKRLKVIEEGNEYKNYYFKHPIKKFSYLHCPFFIDLENDFMIKVFKVLVDKQGTTLKAKWIHRDNLFEDMNENLIV